MTGKKAAPACMRILCDHLCEAEPESWMVQLHTQTPTHTTASVHCLL